MTVSPEFMPNDLDINENPLNNNGTFETDHQDIESKTLRRLLEEVRNEEPFQPNAYNRMHNRHNR